MRIALHTCCGPCLLEPMDDLSRGGDRVTVVYCNPNIHPRAEYERRRDTLGDYARERGIDVIEIDDPDAWDREVRPHGAAKTARCAACYRLRLRRVAQWAAENRHDAIATTLTVSPYQDQDALDTEGRRAADSHGLRYVGRDFSDLYSEATRRSRALGMYRQNYCGCVFSEAEAAEERELRRAERRARKET